MANLTITAAEVAPVEVREKISGYAAEAVAAGQYVRVDTTTGKLALGNGSAAGEARNGGIALRSVVAGQELTILRKGILFLGDALDALTFDDDVFLSDTDGTLADAAGTVSVIVGTVVPLYGQAGPGGAPDKGLRVDL